MKKDSTLQKALYILQYNGYYQVDGELFDIDTSGIVTVSDESNDSIVIKGYRFTKTSFLVEGFIGNDTYLQGVQFHIGGEIQGDFNAIWNIHHNDKVIRTTVIGKFMLFPI